MPSDAILTSAPAARSVSRARRVILGPLFATTSFGECMVPGAHFLALLLFHILLPRDTKVPG